MKKDELYKFQQALYEVGNSLTSTEQELVFNERIIPFYSGKAESISLADLAEVIGIPLVQVAAIESQIHDKIKELVRQETLTPQEVGVEPALTKLVKFKLKSDGYSSAWGGSSRFLDISCGACGQELFMYQKDAPGNLFKFFVPRIVAPPEMIEKVRNLGGKALTCPNPQCNTLLAMPTTIVGDDRLAMRIVGPVRNKLNQKGLYPVPIEIT